MTKLASRYSPRRSAFLLTTLLVLTACSKDAPPLPEPGPCSILLGSQDGFPPNLEESSTKWPLSTPWLDGARLVADQAALARAGAEGRQWGTPSHVAAIQFLLGRLAEIGLDPVGAGYEHEFVVPGRGTGTNLLARLAGTDGGQRCFLVGAHYDGAGCDAGSAECHAADDNASGVAATLAIASYLKSHPPRQCVVFALFDLEEAGLLGSKSLVESPPVELQPLADHLAFVLVADMLSRSSREVLYGATRSDWLGGVFSASQPHTAIALKLEASGALDAGDADLVSRSDSKAFAAIGIPTMLLTSGYHIMLHGRSDSLQCTDPIFFAAAAEAVLSVLLAAAQDSAV